MLSIEEIEHLEYSTSMAKCKGCTNNCRLTINKFSGGRKFITGNRCERGLGKENPTTVCRTCLRTKCNVISVISRLRNPKQSGELLAFHVC